MTDELDPKTLDLIGVLSGRDYPTLDIEVYFNEALGFSINELRKVQASAESRGLSEDAQKVHGEIQELVSKASSEKYIISLKAVPESVRRGITTQVQKDFPDKSDLLGRPQPNPEADEVFTKKIWGAYLTRVEGPDGSATTVTEKEVNALFANAPATVHSQINEAIGELQNGAKAGFEFAAKEIDFLSQASPEA